MPAKNPRINITFEEVTAQLLTRLAKQEKKSVASLTRDLILEALETREDIALSELARVRDTQKSKRVKHKNAWK